MESKQTLQTLTVDCLLHIFAELTLPEVLVFRAFSRQLKAAVDEHIRLVDTLPVILSSPSSRSNDSRLKRYVQRSPRADHYRFDDVSFGPPSLGWTLFDDERILHKQEKHFRRENFVIVPNSPTALEGFIDFISKYMPGVTKLALLIDYAHVWNHVWQILNVYKKQLNLILLDKTSRSGLDDNEMEELDVPEEFFAFIDSLEVLEELYFFPKKHSLLLFAEEPYAERFIDSMLRKLRVFYVNGTGLDCFRFDAGNYPPAVFENLEEMFCTIWRMDWPRGQVGPYDTRLVFPKLKKLIIVDNERFCSDFVDESRMPNLEEIYFDNSFPVDLRWTHRLNNFPKLERIHCYSLRQLPGSNMFNLINFGQRFGRPELENYINQTIKHIVIENQNSLMPVDILVEETARALPYFAALETVTIQKPYMKLTVEELTPIYRSIHDQFE